MDVFDNRKKKVIKKTIHSSGKIVVSLRKNQGRFTMLYLANYIHQVTHTITEEEKTFSSPVVVHLDGNIHNLHPSNLKLINFNRHHYQQDETTRMLVDAVRSSFLLGEPIESIVSAFDLIYPSVVRLIVEKKPPYTFKTQSF